MEFPPNERVPNLSKQGRFLEIETYLQKPNFKRDVQELRDITPEERKFLAHRIREIYNQAKQETDQNRRLQLMTRFYDCLPLLLSDPIERKMAYCPPDEVGRIVYKKEGNCLGFGTGTSGERIYFKTYNEVGRQPGRYMIYPHPTDSTIELGRKYFARFNQAFGNNEVNLDKIVLEDL